MAGQLYSYNNHISRRIEDGESTGFVLFDMWLKATRNQLSHPVDTAAWYTGFATNLAIFRMEASGWYFGRVLTLVLNVL